MKGHARDLMTPGSLQAEPETPLSVLASDLERAGIGGLPVVEDAQVVGFVSETDVMTALLQGRSPRTPAKELMTSPCEVIDEFAPTDAVITILRLRHIHHLPVVREGRLVGTISPADVVRYFVNRVMPASPSSG